MGPLRPVRVPAGMGCINNGMAMYFKDTYPCVARDGGPHRVVVRVDELVRAQLGGYFSDLANAYLGMQGRIIVHTIALLGEAFLIMFSTVDEIAHAIITLVLFSCCVQAAEATFGIVPYVAQGPRVRVRRRRRGRHVGAVVWGLMFMFGDAGKTGYRGLGIIIMASAGLSVFVKIKGRRVDLRQRRAFESGRGAGGQGRRMRIRFQKISRHDPPRP